MRQEKDDKAIMECYVELFKQSNPSADFEKLVEKTKKPISEIFPNFHFRKKMFGKG